MTSQVHTLTFFCAFCVCSTIENSNPHAIDDKSEATEPAPKPKRAKKSESTAPSPKPTKKAAKKQVSSSNNDQSNDDGSETNSTTKKAHELKRKRKSITKHKKMMTKKDRTLPKSLPKEELTVTETRFLGRIASLTREWFNELAPGIHQHHLHTPSPTSYAQHHHPHKTIPSYTQHVTQRRLEEYQFSITGTQGKIPGPLPNGFSVDTQI